MPNYTVILEVTFNEVEADSAKEAEKQVEEDFEAYAQPNLVADNWTVTAIDNED